MRKIILFIGLLLPLHAEIDQTSPKETLSDLPFWSKEQIMEGEFTYNKETHQKFALRWDKNPETFLYVQSGRIIDEGDPGWRDWTDDNPDDPIVRYTQKTPSEVEGEPDIVTVRQILINPIYQRTREAIQKEVVGPPVLNVLREMTTVIPKPGDSEYDLVLRNIQFKDVNAIPVPFEDPSWVSIMTSDWSDRLEIRDQGEIPPTPTGFKLADTGNPVTIEVQASATMEDDTWQTRMVYIPPINNDKEFYRVLFNQTPLQVNE